MKFLSFSLLCVLFFLVFLKFGYAQIKVIGVSPLNQIVCVANEDIKIVSYTVSSDSSSKETFYFYVIDLDWVYVNRSLSIPPRSAIQVPFYVAPKDKSEGNYTTKMWVCTYNAELGIIQKPNNESMSAACLEVNMGVEVSERCRLPKKDYNEYVLLISIPLLMAIFYSVSLRYRGK